MSALPELQSRGALRGSGRFPAVAERLRYPLTVYVASRLVYLAVALIDVPLRGYPLVRELRNWDGVWYVRLAAGGYPHYLPTHYGDGWHGPGGWSTLGFEPLYSMLMWFTGAIFPRGVEAWGVIIALVSGGVAVVEIAVLAERWFGTAGSRRAVLFLCFFPGTIVFSMVYPEGLTLALVAGALLCLEDRRWVLAGVLAGLATAIEPVAFAIIPACAAVALRELWRAGHGPVLSHGGGGAGVRGLVPRSLGGWSVASGRALLRGLGDPVARRALWAPLLSPVGAGAFAVFLWFWVGTPTGNYTAQRVAWGEKSSILAVFIQARTFLREFTHWQGWSHVNLNLPTGFLGAVLLLWGIRQMWLSRRGLVAVAPAASTASSAQGLAVDSGGVTEGSGPVAGSAPVVGPDAAGSGAAGSGAAGSGAAGPGGRGISLGAWVWTLGVAVLTLTSDKTPPNPRMLLCAFPALVAIAAPRSGRRQRVLLGISGILLVAMSIGTFAGGGLRP